MVETRVNQSSFTYNAIRTLSIIIVIGVFIAFIFSPLICSNIAFQKAAIAEVKQLSSQLEMYRQDNLTYPTTSEGLQALVVNLGDKKNWRQILPKVARDPWGNEYYYQYPGTKNPSSFDVWSYGADGIAGGEGLDMDIGNWEKTTSNKGI